MAVTVKLRYLRITPRKVREVADLIRGKKVQEAQTILEFLVKKPAKPLLKLLKSAVAASENDFKLEQSNLYLFEIFVDEAPKLKRWRASSRGRVSPIIKRVSHVTLILEEIEKKKKQKVKKDKKPKKTESVMNQEKTIKEQDSVKEAKIEQDSYKFKRERENKKPERKIGLRRIFQRKAF